MAQELPSNDVASPPSSTAVQKESVGHETELSVALLSMVSGALQELPFHVTASESLTATQKEAETHDTELSAVGVPFWEAPVPIASVGVLQVVPLKVAEYPRTSTARQKVEVGQDTELIGAVNPPTSVGALHELPL